MLLIKRSIFVFSEYHAITAIKFAARNIPLDSCDFKSTYAKTDIYISGTC